MPGVVDILQGVDGGGDGLGLDPHLGEPTLKGPLLPWGETFREGLEVSGAELEFLDKER
jgi:hypothetical protein